MINDQLAILQQLRTALQGESCTPKGALIKLGTNPEKAPSLNYNLPQSTSFVSYGDIKISLNSSVFKPIALSIPANNIFDKLTGNSTATAIGK